MDDQPQLPALQAITFTDGRHARAVTVQADAPAEAIVEALAVGEPKAVVLVFGSANSLKDEVRPRLADLFNRGVARAAAEAQAVIMDGGTQAGVMKLCGDAVADRGHKTPLIGVSPLSLVTYPGGPGPGSIPNGAPLDPNHSHFVLVAPGAEWGAERATIFKLAGQFGQKLPVVALLAAGGELATEEALQTVRQGWPMIVVKGSGGTADQITDEIARRQKPKPSIAERIANKITQRQKPSDTPADPRITEIVDDGKIQAFDLKTGTPNKLARMLDNCLKPSGSDELLRMAWVRAAQYGQNAKRQQNTFWRQQGLILILGVVASIVAIAPESLQWLSNAIGVGTITPMAQWLQDFLRWIVVALTASIGLLIAYNNRFNSRQQVDTAALHH